MVRKVVEIDSCGLFLQKHSRLDAYLIILLLISFPDHEYALFLIRFISLCNHYLGQAHALLLALKVEHGHVPIHGVCHEFYLVQALLLQKGRLIVSLLLLFLVLCLFRLICLCLNG